jgi:hypothetical protein
MIQEIQIGEIIRIEGREFLVVEAPIGGCDKKRPSLVLLKNLLKGIYRKSYFKHKSMEEEE